MPGLGAGARRCGELLAMLVGATQSAEIGAFAELNTVAAETDAVFVFLPGKKGNQGKPPTIYSAAAVLLRDPRNIPPAWEQRGIFIGTLRVTRDPALWPNDGIISLHDAVRAGIGEDRSRLRVDPGLFLPIPEEALVLAAACLGADPKAGKDGWINLFDGKTLDGWKAGDNAESWSVRNGAITGDGERSHLFYMGLECEN